MAGKVRKAMREQNMFRALHGLSASISKDMIELHRLSLRRTPSAISLRTEGVRSILKTVPWELRHAI